MSYDLYLAVIVVFCTFVRFIEFKSKTLSNNVAMFFLILKRKNESKKLFYS